MKTIDEILIDLGIDKQVEDLAEAGIDSLKLVEIISDLEYEHQIIVPLELGLEIMTITELVALIEKHR